MLSRQGSISIAPGPSTSPTPSNNGHATPMPSSQSTTTTNQKQHRQEQFRNEILHQQRWLLFLRHCAKCKSPNCTHGNMCSVGRALWNHLVSCNNDDCSFPRCVHARSLLRHYQKCPKVACPICAPVCKYVDRAQPSRGSNAQQGSQGMALIQPPMANTMIPTNMSTGQMLVSNNLMPSMPNGMIMNGMSNGMAPSQSYPGMPSGYVPPNNINAVKREARSYWGPGQLSDSRSDIKRIRTYPPTDELKIRDMTEIKVCISPMRGVVLCAWRFVWHATS
jgi:hypothetical protein